MADEVPVEVEKTPTADVSVNKPASGSYGEVAELEALKRGMATQGDQEHIQAVGPSTQTPSLTPIGEDVDSDLPLDIKAPTALPEQDIRSKPPELPQHIEVDELEMSAVQSQRTFLEYLVNSPTATEATKEWARVVLSLIEGA